VSIAAMNGHSDTIGVLASLGADVKQANKNGQTPLSMAIYSQNSAAVDLLRGLGATLPIEELDIFTVEDVVGFFKTLAINAGGGNHRISTFEANLREANIDAAALFAIPDGPAMLKLLDPSMHREWGTLFYNVVQSHKAGDDYPVIEGDVVGIEMPPQPTGVTRLIFGSGPFGVTVYGTGNGLVVTHVEPEGSGAEQVSISTLNTQ
jgi:hypothetical protein